MNIRKKPSIIMIIILIFICLKIKLVLSLRLSLKNRIKTMMLQQQYMGTKITLLQSNQMALSPSGGFKLTMQLDGNLVLSSVAFTNKLTADKVLWQSFTNSKATNATLPFYATMQNDGNFVIYSQSNVPFWATMTNNIGASPQTLLLQDDGNLAIYDNNGNIIWATGTFVLPLDTTEITTLNAGQSVLSPNKYFNLAMQIDGNLVVNSLAPYNGYTNDLPLWATMTNSQANTNNTKVVMQTDGNFVMYTLNNGAPIWNSATFQKGKAPYRLLLQNDGNLVIYDCTKQPTWSTGTWNMPGTPIVTLNNNQTAFSQNQQYRLTMQTDGNLVLYKISVNKKSKSDKVLWASNTNVNTSQYKSFYSKATMQADGNFVVYRTSQFRGSFQPSTNSPWASATNGKGTAPYHLLLQNDGNLVIYDKTWTSTWASNTSQSAGKGSNSGSGGSSGSSSSSSSSAPLDPVCLTQTPIGISGKCAGSALANVINDTISHLNGDLKDLLNEVVSPVLTYIGNEFDMCLGDFSGNDLANVNSLSNVGCSNANLDPNAMFSVLGIQVPNVTACMDKNGNSIQVCLAFDSCGTFYASMNGGIIQCLANLASGGFNDAVEALASALSYTGLGFSPQRKFTQNFNITVRSGNNGVTFQNVTTRGHFMFNIGLQLPLPNFYIGTLNLADIINFSVTGQVMVDFGSASDSVTTYINTLRHPNKQTIKASINALMSSGAELSAIISGSFAVQLSNLSRGFFNNVNFNFATATILITTGASGSASGVSKGIYLLINGGSLTNLANLFSDITSKYASIFKEMGFDVPSSPQLDQNSFISFFIDDQYTGLQIQLNNFKLICMFQFSSSSASCNFGNKFFTGIAQEAGMIIQEATQFFDQTGQKISQFALTTETDISKALKNTENKVQVVAQATIAEAQQFANQVQQKVNQLAQEMQQVVNTVESDITNAWNSVKTEWTKLFN